MPEFGLNAAPRQGQKQTQQQRFHLTPRQQQELKFLQMPRQDLESLVKQKLEECPMLERLNPEVTTLDFRTDEDQERFSAYESDDESGYSAADAENMELSPLAMANRYIKDENGEYMLADVREEMERKQAQELEKDTAPWTEDDDYVPSALPLSNDELRDYDEIANLQYPPEETDRRSAVLERIEESRRPEKERELMREILAQLDDRGFWDGEIADFAQARDLSMDEMNSALAGLQEILPGLGARCRSEAMLFQLRAAGRCDAPEDERVWSLLLGCQNPGADWQPKHKKDEKQELEALRSGNLHLLMDASKWQELKDRTWLNAPELVKRRRQLEDPAYIRFHEINLSDTVAARAYETSFVVRYDAALDRFTARPVKNFSEALHVADLAERYGEDYTRDAATRKTMDDWFAPQIKEAEEFMANLRFREDFLQKLANFICVSQRRYLFSGREEDLLPMTQLQAAELVGRDNSWVSRAIAGKGLMLPGKIFRPFKFFFNSSGIRQNTPKKAAERILQSGVIPASSPVENPQEGAVSAGLIKARIRDVIAQEDSARPLSDSAIQKKLESDYQIAVSRRVIVKYREQMGIPSSYERKVQI